jgi:hemerythrin superfamily protein
MPPPVSHAGGGLLYQGFVMPTVTRAASSARNELLAQLKEDHKRVRKAYRDFQKLDPEQDREDCEVLVQEVLRDLTVHMALEEELLYPAARNALKEVDLIDEAEVEHESAHALMDQLQRLEGQDDKHAARFGVLCEYVLHHVKEEEGELFPALEKAKLDWHGLSMRIAQRRAELSAEEGAEAAAFVDYSDDADDASTRHGGGRRGASKPE